MTDADALHLYATQKDPEAFASLVERYQQMVFTVCMRRLNNHEADARDAMQDTFVKLAKSAGSIRGNLVGWLHRCATTSSIDLVRSESRRRQREQASAALPGTQGFSSAGAADPEWAEVRVALDEALDEMPERYRVLVLQRYLAGRSQKDLAEEYGVSQSMISRNLAKAVDVLRQRLAGKGFVLGAIALTAGMDAEAGLATPTGLAGWPTMVGVAGLGGGSGAGVSTAGASGGVSGTISGAVSGVLSGGVWATTKAKLAAVLAAGVLTAGGAGVWVVTQQSQAVSQDSNALSEPSYAPPGEPTNAGGPAFTTASSPSGVLLFNGDGGSLGFDESLHGMWRVAAGDTTPTWAVGSRVVFSQDQYAWRSADGTLMYHGRLESVAVRDKSYWREATVSASSPDADVVAWVKRRPFMFWDVEFEPGPRFVAYSPDGGSKMVFERAEQ